MNNRILTIFYPKINSNRIGPKVESMSKLDLTEKINHSKFDYFDIMSKIKAKNKELGNLALFHDYLFYNNKQKQNYIKYKLIQKSQHQTALITEPTYNKKKFSLKKTFQKNLTFSDSENNNKLIVRKKLNTPRKINRIIKFEEEKKAIKTIKLFKKNKPIELRSSYKDFIAKINKYNFFKYSNSKSDYAHNIRVSFYVDKINKSLKKEKKNNDKYLLREKEKMEDEKELRDKVFYPSLELQKISEKIKSILNKFNQIEIKEPFFDKFENRINFLYDNFKPPNIKNNLTKIRIEDLYLKKNDLGLINRVGNSAINYISNVRIKIQRERDERLKFLTEKSRITKKYGYYKKLSSSHIYNSKEEIQKIIYKNYYLKNENDDIAPQKETIELDEIFEKRNYFEDKYEKYDKVFIAEPRLRNAIFRNDNCKIKPKKDNEKVIKFLLI